MASPALISHSDLASGTILTPRASPTASLAVLLATDGSDAADGAVLVAYALAGTIDATVEVLAVVVPPRPDSAFPLRVESVMPAPGDTEHGRQLEHRWLDIRKQTDRLTDGRTAWQIDIRTGAPFNVIAREIAHRQPSLVIMGLRRHAGSGDTGRDETTLQVIRRSQVPVLAVPATQTTLPRTVVVAVDFSRASLHAARTALGLMQDGGTLLLTHVRPELSYCPEQVEGWSAIYSHGIADAFTRLQVELAAPDGVTVETVFLDGAVAPEILALAQRVGADLIASGSHRHTFVNRMLLGRVTTALVREAPCSLLITPPEPNDHSGHVTPSAVPA